MNNNVDNITMDLKNKINNNEFSNVSDVTKYIDSFPISLESKSLIFEHVRPDLENKFLSKKIEVPIISDNNLEKTTADNAKEEKYIRVRENKNNKGFSYFKLFVIMMIEAIVVLGVITFIVIK